MNVAPTTKVKLVEVLRDMADKVESGECDEGSIEFGPFPEEMGRVYWEDCSPEVKGWYEPAVTGVELPGRGSVNMRMGKQGRLMSASRFAVVAVYRFGRDIGQGGTRMIGYIKGGPTSV